MTPENELKHLAVSVNKYIREVQVGLVHSSPVIVTIKNQTYAGCRYLSRYRYERGMDAVSRGYKTTEDTYDRHNIYLVGELPKVYQKAKRETITHSKRICFQISSEADQDWYVSCYYQENTVPANIRNYHPFGKSFMLSLWDVGDGSKIDDDLPEYQRVQISVEEISYAAN